MSPVTMRDYQLSSSFEGGFGLNHGLYTQLQSLPRSLFAGSLLASLPTWQGMNLRTGCEGQSWPSLKPFLTFQPSSSANARQPSSQDPSHATSLEYIDNAVIVLVFHTCVHARKS
jgi:hypothetical protein